MTSERIILLRLAYDGTDYCGWQIQPRDPTIQRSVQDALGALHGHPTKVWGASRTDAGVHARGQVCHFYTTSGIPAVGYRRGLNRHLPDDISVIEARHVDNAFHARHSARGKHYCYTLWNAPSRHPLVTRYAWHREKPLDLDAMNEAAAALVGTHDFEAFRAAGCDRDNAVRTLWRFECLAEGEYVRIHVEGTAFLKHMVRALTGSLFEVGRGKVPPSWMAEVLESRDRRRAGLTAPPPGALPRAGLLPDAG